eukprot:1196123-Prorocentrum_minimum.AAC.4
MVTVLRVHGLGFKPKNEYQQPEYATTRCSRRTARARRAAQRVPCQVDDRGGCVDDRGGSVDDRGGSVDDKGPKGMSG